MGQKKSVEWPELIEYACGEVGLRPDEFWSMTWRELEIACKGYETRRARSLEIERLLLGSYWNANRGQGKPAVNIEKMIPFITDKKQTKPDLITKEEYDKLSNLKVNWQSRS